MMKNTDVLERLAVLMKERKSADPNSSYVASLYGKGRKKIAQKVGEEAVETAIAAVDGSHDEVIAESADLIFHLMVLWADMDIRPEEVYAELARREGISGIEEKKSRG
ncbi:phosphoribosyl-ATP diphosphatase [Emcibacter sp.]|uniref:phosphoribosyl-ATP diphosphatase n=1 Tax=Emcibacter sp. TaxID=1979954 RepID=UPI002AA677FD|nr:phosphoribosyl-ATP diphosphatase [Emcibacter sp.]